MVGAVDLRPRGRSGVADVGVLTVLAVESQAIADLLVGGCGYRVRTADGLRFHHATLGATRVVALESLHLGRSGTPAAALDVLSLHWAPPVVALVGLAESVHPAVRPGDVVISDEVIRPAARHALLDGHPVRAPVAGPPRTLRAPGMIGRRLNAFFAEHGPLPSLADDAGEFGLSRGPLATGHPAAHRALAVEPHAAGLAEAVHEHLDRHPAPTGWLTIRGITARSGPGSDARDLLAARRAATALAHLLPHLSVGLPPA